MLSQINSIYLPKSPPLLLNETFRNGKETFRNDFRLWKRRRLKRHNLKPPPPSKRFLRNSLGTPSAEIFSLLTANWIPPAVITLASAAGAISLATRRNAAKKNQNRFDGGECILFASPTPFNRFILLRCGSIELEGGESCGDGNDKLLKKEKHYVRVESRRIEEVLDAAVEYQRVCVGAEDGGVIAMDYPAKLGLSEERGMDTTVLIVAGTPRGSMEENVREFVGDCCRRGLFPVVLNPRGCANSPLTTPRLFTAADSDDICSAIQFITRARPWSTLTGVGWGYGANMLTKYLAEAGEKTPLTAATCIDNPFDLDEATRNPPYNSKIDNITGGLIDILKSNKELFQGKRKGFDVEKALAAKSIREFETAISMRSYGFESIEDFYANCSTRSMIGNLKIPVLFIQNDDGTVPLFSIPRELIAENPFTSLLLCSRVPTNGTAFSWYQQVTIEWLAAVELGLLKGRHPLLQDIDVTINPSKSLALMEGSSSKTDGRRQRLLKLAEVNSLDPSVDPVKKMLTKSAPTAASSNVDLQYNPISVRNQGSDDHDLTELNSISPDSHLEAAGSAENTETTPEESDTGDVLQTTQVVMNMLDVTMPGTLKEEEKKKVVEAVNRGETLVKALQDAVPEDVRGKLTTSVSEILQAQGKNLNFDKLLSINQIANVSSGFKSVIKEKVSERSNTNTEISNDRPSDDSSKQSDDVNVSGGGSPKDQLLEKSPKTSDTVASDSVSNLSDDSGLGKGSTDSQDSDKHEGDASEKVGQFSASGDDKSEATAQSNSSSQIAGSTNSLDASAAQESSVQDDNSKEQESKDTNMPTQVENSKGLSEEQEASSAADITPNDANEAPASPILEGQPSDKRDDDSISKDEKTVQPLPEQNQISNAKNPNFNVTQAFDALTGLDDSTQVAVNSVFGVIEDMIIQLEEKKNEEDQNNVENNDTSNGSVLEKDHVTIKQQVEKQTDGKVQEDTSCPGVELVNGNNSVNNVEATSDENDMKENLATVAKVDKHSHISPIPSNLTTDPLTKALYKEYLHSYIISKLNDVKSFGLDATDGLYLHYVPEEGHWILLENLKDKHGALTYNSKDKKDIAKKLFANEDDIIEPSYVILDKDAQRGSTEELESKELLNHRVANPDSTSDNSISSVKAILLDSLKVQVSRRLSVTDMNDMEDHLVADMEKVAEAVCLAIEHDEKNQHASISGVDDNILESSWPDKNHIVEAISQAVQETSYLKKVLPVGVVVGSSLAALRNCCDGTAVVNCDPTRMLNLNIDHNNFTEVKSQLPTKDDAQVPVEEKTFEPVVKDPKVEEESVTLDTLNEVNGNAQSKVLNKDTFMAGAVTAALGASALLTTQQEGFMESASFETSSGSEERHTKSESSKLEEAGNNKHQSNIVTSLAQKAMSVAAPVVPTKEDGEVDHDRLVNSLAELGQRGGMLRLVAKLALLWGGLRGAISLTDRLLSFLRVAERPLVQRIPGFFCMVLVLWSPVLVPLLPSLFSNMATQNSSGIAELACIVGLYAAVTILVMQWGKRVRGYKHPLKQYGLDLMSSRKIQEFLTGLAGGVVLVLAIHSVNAFLGFVSFSLPTNLCSSSLNLTAKLKAYGQLILLAGRGLLMAAGVTFVEELLFRSWLLEEVAADLGYHPAILLSGLAFSLSQRSVFAIPGLWLLSMCLAGARLREGSLFIPIGLRTGIMSSSFFLQAGGFLICQPRSQFWVAGMHPLQPFTGVVGILSALLLAVVLYPRQPGLQGKVPRTIRA